MTGQRVLDVHLSCSCYCTPVSVDHFGLIVIYVYSYIGEPVAEWLERLYSVRYPYGTASFLLVNPTVGKEHQRAGER